MGLATKDLKEASSGDGSEEGIPGSSIHSTQETNLGRLSLAVHWVEGSLEKSNVRLEGAPVSG